LFVDRHAIHRSTVNVAALKYDIALDITVAGVEEKAKVRWPHRLRALATIINYR
jgi:hypothetical protein